MESKPEPAGPSCPNCGRETNEFALRECAVCRKLSCRNCGVAGYGREFCSERCRGFFYHGDEDDVEE
jgi:hypothetical protein